MEARTVGTIYLKSSALILFFIAATISITLIVHLLLVDFIHGNPHRVMADTIETMAIMTPIIALLSAVATVLVLALPQSFEAFLTWKMMQKIGAKGRFSTLVALPVTAVLTWYCYDYLTPSDFSLGINEGSDWEPYKHGLTLSRWLSALFIQVLVTLFNFLYMQSQAMQIPKKVVIFTILGLAGFIGCVSGYLSALDQYQYL